MSRPVFEMDKELNQAVGKIVDEVRSQGDKAVLKYNIKFDNNDNEKFELTPSQIKSAYNSISDDVFDAINYAMQNIKDFAQAQFSQLKDFSMKRDYGTISQKVIPLESVGCYIPGGRYPLLSSALMSVIPAKVAGVENIIVCSPNIKPEVIVAADMAGATRIFNLGGVQAIAAMAYGTGQVPSVNKVVGPGNRYVTEAKKLCYGDVGIDFVAGPSELMIIADDSANIDYVKADLASQKEHDPEAEVCLLEVLSDNYESYIASAISLANQSGPEHLQLMVKDPEKYLSKLKNYGSLFIGNDSSVVFGDYCSGTNHILPTENAARYTGGLSVFDFVKITTTQEIKPVEELVKATAVLARVEGLQKHREAAEIRKK